MNEPPFSILLFGVVFISVFVVSIIDLILMWCKIMELREDVETLERKKLMREELLERYQAAINHPSKETVCAYKEAQTRIGPVVAVSEILKVEELKAFLKEHEWAGNEENTRCPKCGAFSWNGHEEWCDFPRMISL